jgi:hypothetical protein
MLTVSNDIVPEKKFRSSPRIIPSYSFEIVGFIG